MNGRVETMWLRAVAADPGAARFRAALRVVIAAAAALAAVMAVGRVAAAPASLALVGVIVAMVGQVAVSDRRDDEQRRTWGWLTPWAVASAAIGVVAADAAPVRDACFLALVFTAIFVRRFGVRASAVGTVSFMSFFDAIVLHPGITALPGVILSVVVGVGVGYAVRFCVIPERSPRTLRATARALAAAARLCARSRSGQQERDRRRLLTAALAMDRELVALAEVGAVSCDTARAVRLQVLSFHAAADAGRQPADIDLPPIDPRAPVPVVNFSPVGPQPFTTQAVQALCGAALALAGGELLSATRWYWAVLASFVVFNRAPTTGHTFVRAVGRVVGTVIGLVAGLALADMLRAHARVALALIFPAMGIAYYLLTVSYAWTLVCFTICLALLYSVMSELSPSLMYLRLALTAIGAGAGTLAAVAIRPIRTSVFVAQQVEAVFDGMAETFGALRGTDVQTLIDGTRHVDAAIERVVDGLEALRESRSKAWPVLASLASRAIGLGRGLRRVAARRAAER